jgi:hypothetical protein
MPAGEFSTVGSSSEGTARGIAKVFRELTVYGDPEALHALIAGIERRLADGWFRGREHEESRRRFSREHQFCFVRRPNAEHPEVALLMNIDGRRLMVSNIVPNGHELSRAQYNWFLVEFYLRFLHPAAEEAGLSIELSSDERSLEREYGWQGDRLLKEFSGCANKSCRHPADQRRWMDFLIYLHHHRPNRDYGFDLLASWLIYDGWSVDKTRELISEAEFALHLLNANDAAALGLAE